MNLEAPPWLVAWLQSFSVWDLIIWTAAIAATVVFIRKKGWRTVIAMARGILYAADILAAVQDLPEWQKRIEQKVDGIHHETHKNDGSSIKDAVLRVEQGVEGLHGRLDNVERDVKSLADAEVELRAELEHTQDRNDRTT